MRLLFACLVLIGIALAVPHARAADDPFTVSGIKVDASAQSTIVAQTLAINSGRDRAWQTLYRRLTKQQDWARQPTLDPLTLQRLVRSYQVHNARSSTTRFVAEVTYVFNPNAVRRILQEANVAYTDLAARPILVIPMAPGWSAHTPWTQAWADPRFAHGSIPLVLPVADAIDAQTLATLRFDSATWQDVEPMASRVHASDAYLALVVPQRAQMIVKIRRLGSGNEAAIPELTIPVPPKTPAARAFATVADAVASAIVNSWKAHTAIDFGKRSKVVASLHVDSLEDWSETLQRLATVQTITDINVVAMDIGEARVEISYVGSTDQLNEELSHAGLGLENEDGQVWLAKSSPATSSE